VRSGQDIEVHFGTDKALAYLIGEKFLNLLEAAEDDAEFRREIASRSTGDVARPSAIVEARAQSLGRRRPTRSTGERFNRIVSTGSKSSSRGKPAGGFTEWPAPPRFAPTDRRLADAARSSGAFWRWSRRPAPRIESAAGALNNPKTQPSGPPEWAKLPEAIRRAIVAVVEAAGFFPKARRHSSRIIN
jgi:hypothetical protein